MIEIIEYKRALEKVSPRLVMKAVASALNKIASRAKTEVKKTIRTKYAVKAKAADVKLDKAHKNRFMAVLRGSYRPLPLTLFKHRNLKRGVKIEVLKGESKLLPKAFVAQPSGINYRQFGQQRQVNAVLPLVLQRVGKNAYPLKALSGPSVGAMMKNEEVKNKVEDVIRNEYAKNLAHELEYRLSKVKG